jgi:hypothetical protein
VLYVLSAIEKLTATLGQLQWQFVHGQPYHFDKQKVTYDQAVDKCKSRLGKLFEPKDLETNKKVYEAAVLAMGESNIWIGVNDKATEGR